ncbi:hypothetical protein F4802DRAFT_614629 [Xylaria palmicola]|nr:hypothetical protein F4802DRAFT_614629 [Xylaria palmicola]
MEEPSSAQPLTEDNLRRLQGKKVMPPGAYLSSCSSGRPIDRLERAKYEIYWILYDLQYTETGAQILEREDVCKDGHLKIRYRGNAVPDPDAQGPEFWEAILQRLEKEHGDSIRVYRAKEKIYFKLCKLGRLGDEGRQLLDEYELYIAGKQDVRYRGNENPNLGDPRYWEAQIDYVNSVYISLLKARHPPKPRPPREPPNTEELGEIACDRREREYLRSWEAKTRGIESWVDAQGDDKGYTWSQLLYEEPVESDDDDSIGLQSEIKPYSRWRVAYRGVYERMAALWRLGGEGREIIKNDELRIMSIYNVRYRRSRGPKPNLQDPSYWEARWQYFTEKYISLLQKPEHNPKLLSELTSDPYTIPAPGSSLSARTPVPSLTRSLRPSPESAKAIVVKITKGILYKVISHDYFKNEGRHVLENDDIYIAGKKDIRYKPVFGPEPDLKRNSYWVDKLNYFLSEYEGFLAASAPLQQSHPPGSDQSETSTILILENACPLRQNEAQKPNPIVEWLFFGGAPIDRLPNSHNTIRTKPTELPRGANRKRGAHLDDTGEADSQLLHPTKRIKVRMGQATAIRTTAAAPSPGGSTGNAPLPPSQAPKPTIDRGADQVPVVPDVIEDSADKAMPTAPQRIKRQRKAYVKERASRRLAGQMPEFGLLPKRSEEPARYEGSSQRDQNVANTGAPGSRSGRLPKKPTSTREAKPQGVSKSSRGRADRFKKSRQR